MIDLRGQGDTPPVVEDPHPLPVRNASIRGVGRTHFDHGFRIERADRGQIPELGVDLDSIEEIWMGSGYKWDQAANNFEILP